MELSYHVRNLNMKEGSELKCTCAHCGHSIEYTIEEAGKTLECPNCKEKSLLPLAETPNQRPASKPGQTPSNSKPVNRVGIGIAGVLIIGTMVLLPQLLHRHETPANVETPPAVLPQPPRTKMPKSLNDLKIGSFTLQRRDNDLWFVVGDIANVSDTLHRGIKVELELRDAQGLKVGSLDAFINELVPHGMWHVLARTSDPRAASVRVAGIKEEP